MLEVRLASLKPGRHTLTFHPSAEELLLDPAEFREVAVDVRLDYEPNQVYVELAARAMATLECDRTLVSFEQPVEGRYAMLFTATEGGEEAADVQPLPPDAEALDLSEAVRDTLVLALPARRVAPGAEEKPLQTQYGALLGDDGEPIDPRWEALRKFKDLS